MLTIRKMMAFKNSFRKKDDYSTQKMILNQLIISGGSRFNMEWFKKNHLLIRHVFTKNGGLEISYCNNATNTNYNGPLESIVYEEGTLKIRGKNFAIDFFEPSHGTIKINRGSSYDMSVYSESKMPSKIVFSYFNLKND